MVRVASSTQFTLISVIPFRAVVNEILVRDSHFFVFGMGPRFESLPSGLGVVMESLHVVSSTDEENLGEAIVEV